MMIYIKTIVMSALLITTVSQPVSGQVRIDYDARRQNFIVCPVKINKSKRTHWVSFTYGVGQLLD